MKPLLAILAFFVFALVFGCSLVAKDRRKKSSAIELERDALLEAIAQVESGNNPHAISQRGERGRCQFTKATWHGYTLAEFETWAASGAPLVRDIERAHYRWIVGTLRARGLTPTPELVAAAWRHGVELADTYRNSDYARRVGNLYSDFLRKEGA